MSVSAHTPRNLRLPRLRLDVIAIGLATLICAAAFVTSLGVEAMDAAAAALPLTAPQAASTTP